MTPTTTDRLPVVDVSLQSPRIMASRNGLALGEEYPTAPARAKLLPPGLPVQQMQPNLLHVGVEAEVAAQVRDGELVALPDRYGKPAEVVKVLERMPWTRDTASPHGHLTRLITKPAQDERTVAEEIAEANRRAREYHERERKLDEEREIATYHRERREKFVGALEDVGVEAAVEALGDDQRAALLAELERTRDAAEGDQPDAA